MLWSDGTSAHVLTAQQKIAESLFFEYEKNELKHQFLASNKQLKVLLKQM